MLDSSALPNVDDLGLEQPVEIAYAAQMAARENALHSIFGPTDPPDQIMSPGDPNLFINLLQQQATNMKPRFCYRWASATSFIWSAARRVKSMPHSRWGMARLAQLFCAMFYTSWALASIQFLNALV